MGTFEYVGILLIIIGVIYIFLQGMGKLSDKGGEIETKILSLKGGAGLILVALGIVLLAMGGGIQLPAGISEKLPLTEEVKTNPDNPPHVTAETSVPSTPMPTKTLAPSTQTPVMPASTTVSLKMIEKESGPEGQAGYVDWYYYVGDDSKNRGEQDFFSFNIAGIPRNATVTDASIYFSAYLRTNDPFQGLGCLGIYEQNFWRRIQLISLLGHRQVLLLNGVHMQNCRNQHPAMT